MRFKFIDFLIFSFILTFICAIAGAKEPLPMAASDENNPETKYLMFQIFTFNGSAFPPDESVKSQMASTVDDIIMAIHITGDKRHKLGFTPGPLTFDHTDEDIQHLIKNSFEIARVKNVAVAFHIDDSMFYEKRRDLLDNTDNIEWIDWDKTPNTGRRLDWSATPTKIAPQLCLNSMEVENAVKKRAVLIGQEIKKEIDTLKREGKEELFAGVIAGWETTIGQDFNTSRYLGYCALSHRGFSAAHQPQDMDQERVSIVQEFIELWAKELATAGIPKEKIYAHIAFTPQGFESNDGKTLSYAKLVHFATPDIAFNPYYRAGFSTYPAPGTFAEIHKELAKHGNPPWASSEGTNVIPNGFAGEPTMETYLGRMFNHGATLVNIFSWGIGGEAEKKKNFFRLATENTEAVSAYKKFLDGKFLTEEKPSLSSQTIFQEKIRKIQNELPSWVQKTGRQSKVAPLLQRLDGLIKNGQFQEADKVMEKIFKLMDSP